jgi:thioesterase domain-containing protein
MGRCDGLRRRDPRSPTRRIPHHRVRQPLRDLAADSAYLAEFRQTLTGPIVLVGHSYGGNVISVAAAGNDRVKALVYLNGWMAGTCSAARTRRSRRRSSGSWQSANATIVEVPASHVSFVSQPDAATQLILQAVETTVPAASRT